MKKSFLPKKLVTFLLLLSITVFSVSTFANAAAPQPINDTYSSYFNDVYPKLTDKAPVFEAITYSKLHYLLQQDGNYVILWGGKTNTAIQNNIEAIDEVAKQYGVTTVYNFDPYLDGGADGEKTNIESTDASTIPYAQQLYTVLNTAFYPTASDTVKSPTLFVYNKDNVVGSISTPVVGKFDISSATDTQALKSGVAGVLDKISTTVNGNKVANAATYIDQQFFTDAFNYQATINNGNTTTNIFVNSDQPIVYKSLTYDELQQLLKSKGNYAILFGGSWCPNTRAAVKWINQEAHAYNIDTVYNFDTHLDDNTHVDVDPLNIRANSVASSVTISTTANNTTSGSITSPIANLFVNLINTYLPNIQTQYNATQNITYTDGTGTYSASKLQVPFLFTYSKDHKNTSGNAAPILRENVVSVPVSASYPNGIKELMFNWATTQPASGSTPATASYTTEVNTADALFQSFAVQNLITQNSSIDANQSKYTADSYQTYTAALANAQTVAADLTASADQVKAAYDQLQKAISDLKLISNDATVASIDTSSGNPHTGENRTPLEAVSLVSLLSIGALSFVKFKLKKSLCETN